MICWCVEFGFLVVVGMSCCVYWFRMYGILYGWVLCVVVCLVLGSGKVMLVNGFLLVICDVGCVLVLVW